MGDPPKEGTEGYPEEQPGNVAEGEQGASQDDRESDDTPDRAGRGDEGTATGNPLSAG